MAGPPGGKQAGQQNLSDHGQHAMGGGDDKSSPESNPNDPGFKYSQLGDDKSTKTDKEMYGQARKNGQGGDHKGPDYTGATSSHYKVNIDDLRQIHKQLEDMAEAAKGDLDQARRIADAQAPAEDQEGSGMHAKALQKWGRQLHDETKQHYQAVRQYSDNLQNIIKQYDSNEHDAMITFKDFQGKL